MQMVQVAGHLAENDEGALRWLDECSLAIGDILAKADLITLSQALLLYASVQEMKADMQRNRYDGANFSLNDLGLFASPRRALKLATIHGAKGREFDAVAMIKLHEGAIPHFTAKTAPEFDAAKR